MERLSAWIYRRFGHRAVFFYLGLEAVTAIVLTLVAIGILSLYQHMTADQYWLIVPTLSPDGPAFPLWLIPAFFGIGGLATAAAIRRLRGHFTLPVKDPFLAVSLRYRQP